MSEFDITIKLPNGDIEAHRFADSLVRSALAIPDEQNLLGHNGELYVDLTGDEPTVNLTLTDAEEVSFEDWQDGEYPDLDATDYFDYEGEDDDA